MAGWVEVNAAVSGAALLQNLDAEFEFYKQGAIKEAAEAGRQWLEEDAGAPGHVPYEYGNLLATVQPPIENQSSVTFRIGGVLTDYLSGKQKPYGFAQEGGWHDRGGNFHEGQHMVENAVLAASRAFLAFMTNPGTATARPGRTDPFIPDMPYLFENPEG